MSTTTEKEEPRPKEEEGEEDTKFKDVAEAHGLMGKAEWEAPELVVKSREATRADQGNMQRAHEYVDRAEVMKAKVGAVADLIRRSRHCVAYCGAGLSKSAGIADYATNPGNTIAGGGPTLGNPFEAKPTAAHRVLAAMVAAGQVKECVQQNHDGLPQKAGIPQEKVNEIHGAWFDPSNPVVQFNGHLRGDLFEWMERTEKAADLCLCLGTSLSGMNADRVAEKPAALFWGARRGLGTVIVNLQRTRLDGRSTIRIWGKLDEVFSMLARELGIPAEAVAGPPRRIDVGPAAGAAAGEGEDVFDVPYGADGVLDGSVRTRLNLREESEVRIAPSGAVNFGKRGRVMGKTPDGDFLIGFTKLRPSVLGRWMVAAAVRGAIPVLPVVNTDAVAWRHGIDPVPPPPPPLPAIAGTLIFSQSHRVVSETVASAAVIPSPAPAPAASGGGGGGGGGDGGGGGGGGGIAQVAKPTKATTTVAAHEWTMTVKGGAVGGIKSVTWKMPPHSQFETLTVVEPPFAVTQRARGQPFVVRAEVVFRAPMSGSILRAEHRLTFEREGEEVATTEVSVDKAEKPGCFMQ